MRGKGTLKKSQKFCFFSQFWVFKRFLECFLPGWHCVLLPTYLPFSKLAWNSHYCAQQCTLYPTRDLYTTITSSNAIMLQELNNRTIVAKIQNYLPFAYYFQSKYNVIQWSLSVIIKCLIQICVYKCSSVQQRLPQFHSCTPRY